MKISIEERKAKKLVIIFYVVGAIGFALPQTNQIFQYLTPFTLLFTVFLLLSFHQNLLNIKTMIVFAAVFLFSYCIEALGVNTGAIFGNYHYGNGLGIKLLNTPIMIGINWLFLSYITASIANKIKVSSFVQASIAALLMLAYDILLETVADFLGMWYWQNSTVPLQNYLAWFFIALLIQIFYKFMNIDFKNPLSLIVYITQVLFLAFIFIIRVVFYD